GVPVLAQADRYGLAHAGKRRDGPGRAVSLPRLLRRLPGRGQRRGGGGEYRGVSVPRCAWGRAFRVSPRHGERSGVSRPMLANNTSLLSTSGGLRRSARPSGITSFRPLATAPAPLSRHAFAAPPGRRLPAIRGACAPPGCRLVPTLPEPAPLPAPVHPRLACQANPRHGARPRATAGGRAAP